MNQSSNNSILTEMVLDAIKTSVIEQRPVKIDLTEASSLTGSGTDKGGRTLFDDAFAELRYANPFRMGSRVVPVSGSDMLFAAKTGNATNTTPWGYTPNNNAGSPNIDVSIWQLPVRDISASFPVRTAVLSDVNNLDATLVQDLILEFSAVEGASMAINNDQAGSTTTSTGATNGLRGLNMYVDGATSAYGTSGVAITNGIHTIATQTATTSITYADLTAAVGKFPSQYWALPGNAWHIRPQTIQALRDLKDLQNLPLFLETGDEDGAAVGRMFGFPVIPNPYLSATYPIYLANWPQFLTIGDVQEMTVQMLDQTAPGFTTLYAEKRVVSSVRNPFAGVRIKL